METVINKIVGNDMFGYKIGSHKKNDHRTLVGGILSLCVKLAWTAYCLFLLRKMVTMDGDTIYQYKQYNGHQEEIDYMKSGMLIYNILSKQDEPLRYGDAARRYIRLQYEY